MIVSLGSAPQRILLDGLYVAGDPSSRVCADPSACDEVMLAPRLILLEAREGGV
jgi:hypothetical protein